MSNKLVHLSISFMAVLAISLFQNLITNYPPPQPVQAQIETKPPQVATKPIKKKVVKNTTPKQKPVKQAPPKPRVVSKPASTASNASITKKFLLKSGFTKNQTAGIMGNLQQEHGFKTDDVAGGLGIAQWLGGRRANLLARKNPYSIHTQLQFMLDELNGAESGAGRAIRSAKTVEQATVAFQNLYERCGVCMEGQRISYAYSFL